MGTSSLSLLWWLVVKMSGSRKKILPHPSMEFSFPDVVKWTLLSIRVICLIVVYYMYNHNYNKIVKSDWLSTALISALIGQFNRTVCVMPSK